MFEALADRLQGIVRNLTGQARITPENIRESLREVRRALLEADVQVGVARDFVARVEARAVGEEVLKSLSAGQQVVSIVKDELERLLGRTPVTLAGSPHVPTVVLLAGLQGSGKTTFAGKLAVWLKARDRSSTGARRTSRRLSRMFSGVMRACPVRFRTMPWSRSASASNTGPFRRRGRGS